MKQCEDGVYRWVYELKMLKNPSVLFTVWKVMGIGFSAPLLLHLILLIVDGTLFKYLGSTFKWFVIIAFVILGLSVVAYVLVAAVNGWKYIVLFEMDEKGIAHIQLDKGVKKAEALGWLTVLVGAAANNPTTMGAGILAGSRDRIYSEFSKIRKIKAYPKRDLIKLNSLFVKNQVYAEEQDYDFVLRYIKEKVKG